MTEKEKQIYNTFLVVSRKQLNKPFTIRKNFSNFEAKGVYPFIRKLSYFFNKFPQINIQTYFESPYKIYQEDKKYFDLKFYTSQSGIKAYTIYQKTLKFQSPDNQIAKIKESLKFIGHFCLSENITLNEYITYKKGVTYAWIKHYLENNVSIFVLLEYQNFYDVLSTIPTDELGLMLEDVYKNYGSLKDTYFKSKKANIIIKEGLIKINDYINNQLKSKLKNNNIKEIK